MKNRKFFYSSKNIISVITMIAGITMFSSGVYTYDTNAKDMAKQTIINNHRVALMQDDLAKERVKYEKQIQFEESQIHTLDKQNSDLKKKITFYKNRSESPSSMKNKVAHKQANHRQVHVVATAYIAHCNTGCSGTTATGINVNGTTTHNGKTIISVDPSIIPLHSIVKVDTSSGKSFLAVAEDTGGAIHGGIIDVLVSSYDEAINFGRQRATITILREGA